MKQDASLPRICGDHGGPTAARTILTKHGPGSERRAYKLTRAEGVLTAGLRNMDIVAIRVYISGFSLSMNGG